MEQHLSWAFIDTRLGEIERSLLEHDKTRLWGIPRGGQVVAGLLAQRNSIFKLAESPPDAEVAIDDIVDSGATAARMRKDYGLHTVAIIDKQGVHSAMPWIVFPWEGDAENDHQSIVIRMLQAIGEDPAREGLAETPERVVRSWSELYSGYGEAPALKWFDDNADEMIVVRNIKFWSTCEHHLLPFHGSADVAYVPNGRVVGVSKIPRIVQHHARKLQLQERLAREVADTLSNGQDESTRPLGVAVHMAATHLCMAARGVRAEGTEMETNVLTGCFRSEPETRAEFFARIK